MTTSVRMGKANDAGLQRRVMDELRWDTRVDETQIGVTVQEGVIILTDAVRQWAQKQAALGAAFHAKGVRSVEDEVKIDPLA
jgi:osmotically-inducible protein OsmY